MKTIKLKVVEMDGRQFDYKEELKTVFRAPADPQRGADYEEMRRSMRVLDALDKANDTLVLEDADFTNLQERVKKARFVMVHPIIVQFIEDVTAEEGT